MSVGYRSESVYGEGSRDAKSVIAHEIFELGNTDILRYLSKNLLRGSKKIADLEEAIDSGDENKVIRVIGYPRSEEDWVQRNILVPINKLTGIDIRYVLWLCNDAEDVRNQYGCTDMDVYTEGTVVLSDLGHAGKLYGYVSDPKPEGHISLDEVITI